jgi:hypothetical protein
LTKIERNQMVQKRRRGDVKFAGKICEEPTNYFKMVLAIFSFHNFLDFFFRLVWLNIKIKTN